VPLDEPRRDRLSTAAFVVGLVSAVTAVVYFVAIPLGLVGLVLGISAMRRGRERRLALAGTLLSVVGLAVGLGVVAFLVAADDDESGQTSVVDGIESGTADDEHPPQLDVGRDVGCRAEMGALRAEGTVTNHTEEPASYQLVIVWEREGRRLAESTAILDEIRAGGSQAWEVAAVAEGDAATSCRVLRIDRTDP
jgi:hypothetical protein